VEAEISHCLVFDDCLGINIGDHRPVHPHHRGVVEERSVIPIAALESDTSIAEAIVDAAVISDARSPISRVPEITAPLITPITWGPKKPDSRWEHPGSGHPVIVSITVSPVARSPDVAGAGTKRLVVNRQNRWSDADGDADARRRCGSIGRRRRSVTRRWRRSVVPLRTRIGLSGPAQHTDTGADGSTSSGAPAATDDAANNRSNSRPLDAAFYHLCRGCSA